MATTNQLQGLISENNLAKISDYAVSKQVAKVVKQSPVAGTPVIQGMTIEVHVVSLSDVPFKVLDEQASLSYKYVPVADVQKVVEADDRLKNAVKSGTIPEQDIGPIIETLNRGLAQSGLTGPITASDAQAMVKSIGTLGLVEF